MPDHWCTQTEKLDELQEAVVRLTVIQEIQTRQLAALEAQAQENTKFKSKVGGIVIATMVGVSAVWGLILGLVQIFRSVKA